MATSTNRFASFLKSILAIQLGIAASFTILAAVEFFFRLNESYHWIKPPAETWPYDSKTIHQPFPPELDDLAKQESEVKYELPDNTPYIADNYLVSTPRFPKIDTNGTAIYLANTQVRHIIKTKSEQVLYDAKYSIDSHNRRVTEKYSPTNRNPILAMMGCSFTFGTGVDDQFSMPWLVSKELKSKRVLNLAIGAGSVNDQLDDLYAHPQRYEDMKNSSGDAVYFIMQDHLRRTTCYDLRCFDGDNWRMRKTRYTATKDGFLPTEKFYQWQWGFLGVIKSWLANESAFIRFYSINFPSRAPDSAISEFADYFQELQKQIKEKLNLRLIVSEYPTGPGEWRGKFVEELERRKIPFLPLVTVYPKGISTSIPGEGHPNPLGQKLWSKIFLKEYSKKFSRPE